MNTDAIEELAVELHHGAEMAGDVALHCPWISLPAGSAGVPALISELFSQDTHVSGLVAERMASGQQLLTAAVSDVRRADR